jgi:hypothetical protein
MTKTTVNDGVYLKENSHLTPLTVQTVGRWTVIWGFVPAFRTVPTDH